jgi:imidazoleglycerol phosphate dehydratase HisB
VGGAQAIAAMAYGTQSIPKVDKIFGPGNRFVTEAKRLVAADPAGAAIDLLAGPSELLVIADEAADPEIVAADLLSQAEHDGQSQVVLVTPCEALAGRVLDEVTRQLAQLPRYATAAKALENSYVLIVNSIEEAVAFSNRYAPEHLIVNTSAAEGLVPHIRHAGSVFLGPHAPVTAGDYASGTNHTLPTGGTARWLGGITIESYLKSMTFQSLTRQGLDRLAPALIGLARAEGLEAHARAVLARQVAQPSAPGTAGTGTAAQASAPDQSEGCIVRQPGRSAHVERKTSETSVVVDVVLDGTGVYRIQTGIGFMDHMLAQLSRHSLIDLRVEVSGDLHVDEHHSVEDVGLTIGEAVRKALGDKRGIERYGFLLPMDESLAQVALDLGGRPFLSFVGEFQREKVGELPTELVEDFFRAFADGLRANLHIAVTGRNDHHKIEAIFKSVARSLKQAVFVNERAASLLPTTKGTL